MKNFKQLLIWQNGIQITKLVYQQLEKIPRNARYELESQMIRSAISIPSNIAEGSSRSSAKDYKRFLEISLGSAYELETQLILTLEVHGVNTESIISEVHSEQKMIASLINKLLFFCFWPSALSF